MEGQKVVNSGAVRGFIIRNLPTGKNSLLEDPPQLKCENMGTKGSMAAGQLRRRAAQMVCNPTFLGGNDPTNNVIATPFPHQPGSSWLPTFPVRRAAFIGWNGETSTEINPWFFLFPCMQKPRRQADHSCCSLHHTSFRIVPICCVGFTGT